jgi:hypothetical protein
MNLLYQKVFSLPMTGTTVHGQLKSSDLQHNLNRYGSFYPTFNQRLEWLKNQTNLTDKERGVYKNLLEREHLLQLRQLHPKKKEIIARYLHTMPGKVTSMMAHTVLN